MATGIEQAADHPAAATRPFPLPGSGRGPALPVGMGRPASSAPVAPAAAPVHHDPAPLDLGLAAEVHGGEAPAGAFASDLPVHEAAPHSAAAPHQGGLPLGADHEASPLLRKPVRAPEPEAAPAEELLLNDESAAPAALPRFTRAAAPEKAPKAAGSTLFERMANLRGGSREAEPEDDDPEGGAALNIPRFLGRQNNQ